MERGTSQGEKSKCTHCSARYDGCSSCSESGGSCLECYQTHLLLGSFEQPCVKCEQYMINCVKCLNKEVCTLRKPARLLLGSQDFTDLDEYVDLNV